MDPKTFQAWLSASDELTEAQKAEAGEVLAGGPSGTPLSALKRKERWLEFGRSLAEGETLKEAAARCRVGTGVSGLPCTCFGCHAFLTEKESNHGDFRQPY
jgi:hypothetical protein